jgi:hypothetical protein
MSVIHICTSFPAVTGLVTIHMTIRIPTLQPIIFPIKRPLSRPVKDLPLKDGPHNQAIVAFLLSPNIGGDSCHI